MGQLQVVWDVPKNASKIQGQTRFVEKGCLNRRCKCVKQGRVCGPALQCITC